MPIIPNYFVNMLVETGGFSILFDTGATGHFMDNAKKLGIDLSHLNAVVVSHGHFDHAGGLVRMLQELDDSVPVYVGDGFLEEKYKSFGSLCWKWKFWCILYDKNIFR